MTRITSGPNATPQGDAEGVQTRAYHPAASLESVRVGKMALRQGASGASVGALQSLLGEAGFEVPVDDRFGPHTRGQLLAFQRLHGITADGVAGPVTLAALERSVAAARDAAQQASTRTVQGGSTGGTRAALTPPRPETAGIRRAPASFAPAAGRASAPFADSAAQRERQAETLLRSNDAWPPTEGRHYVIQIDQDSPPATAPGAARRDWLRSYSGQTVVFKAVDGRLVEQETGGPLRSAAHPGQASATAGTFRSVDGDNTPDIAHLRSGLYDYHGRLSNSGRFNPVSHEAMRVARDIDHDGVIEGEREDDPTFYGTYIQIHAGRDSRPNSVGCQTLPQADFDRLTAALRGARKEGFTYLLVRRPNATYGSNPF